MRLLIVEDENDLRNIVKKRLVKEHYSVDACGDGLEAMDHIDMTSYDGIILDIMLPGKNGYEILRELRRREDDTPVLLLTAKDSIEDRVKGLDLGADDYLIKPFAFEELLARIRVMMRRKPQFTSNQLKSEAITNVKLPKERTNENGSLHVIFGGAPGGENSLLIGSGRMGALIKALKSKYDIIILDTAPSELLADAPLLGKYVDAALYVIRYDYTKLREIREGVESLALSGIDMLGYVFNGDNSSGGQGYGYGYRRYGNYGSYGSHYGSYGKYGAYGHYGKMEKGSTDKFGRVIKD